jgi:hypothetical protein
MVVIDRLGRPDYRVDIYSPSDQPVTASAGVFSSVSAPSIRSQIAHGRVSEPIELAWELDAAIAANLTELGHGG